MKVAIFVVALVAVALAEEPVSYSKPAYKPQSYDYAPRPYSFGYEVKDNYYNDYAHQESSDGKVVSGSYRVLLPDGRTQIVSYKDEGYGFVASVKYEGSAKYPEYTKPAVAYKAAPAPAYKAAPAPAPAYKAAPAPAPAYKAAPAPAPAYKADPAPAPAATYPKPTAAPYKPAAPAPAEKY